MGITNTAELIRLAGAEGEIRGAALAIAELVRSYDKPTIAKEIMNVIGVTVRKARAAGLEEFDLRELRKANRA